MKNLITLLFISFTVLVNAQAFNGKGDTKFQVGANLQDNASGINATLDYGVGDNMSIGVSATYALGIKDFLNADFGDRFDIKARFNANIGDIIGISDQLDLYPGLSLGLKNFGGHLGARYFFSDGFGIFTELNTPFARYKSGLTPAETIHNQFNVSIGASFNL